MIHRSALLVTAVMALGCVAGAGEVTLVDNGVSKAVIVVAPRVMEADNPAIRSTDARAYEVEQQRVALRESMRDLALYLEKMSGAKVGIAHEAPAAGSGLLPIYLADAAGAFGPPSITAPFQQAFRIIVRPDAVALVGESDRAVSYAIYEILHELGCRWFMPSELGEYVPALPTVKLSERDASGAPYTVYRGIWYADADYKRRNRSGGLLLQAGHALEFAYLTKEDKEQNPQWIATVDGQPNPHRLKMSAPGLVDRIAQRISEYIQQHNALSVSLSTDDGLGYDNSPEDRALDAGDIDPSISEVSLTDRFQWFFNGIAERVEKKHPDVVFGMLAYAVNTRPPVREKVHPKIIPQIAPITFSRAQPMTDDGEPNNKDLRGLVEGWGKAAPATSYYFYGFYLAEVSAPNPMIRKWSIDIPIIYQKGNCRYWQPETLTNFETSMHAHYLGLRLAWDPAQDPAAILADLHEKFYGSASAEMAAYWKHIDDVWVDTPEYAGCGFGHLRRWTPGSLAEARRLMNAALAAAKTDQEKFRVQLADDSLSLFELFMKIRRDYADGNWASLEQDVQAYRARCVELGDRYEPQYAFGKMNWTAARNDTINGIYFNAFYQASYLDAARIARDYRVLTAPPLRTWKFHADEGKTGAAAGWSAADFDDTAWATTDTAVDTWSALGYHNYMGAMWYRTIVNVPADAAGKKTFLWISATDGSAKVFVNGQHVPYTDAEGKTADEFVGYCQPASFDITAALKPGSANVVTIYSERRFINELGTGGLLGPTAVYCER